MPQNFQSSEGDLRARLMINLLVYEDSAYHMVRVPQRSLDAMVLACTAFEVDVISWLGVLGTIEVLRLPLGFIIPDHLEPAVETGGALLPDDQWSEWKGNRSTVSITGHFILSRGSFLRWEPEDPQQNTFFFNPRLFALPL